MASRHLVEHKRAAADHGVECRSSLRRILRRGNGDGENKVQPAGAPGAVGERFSFRAST